MTGGPQSARPEVLAQLPDGDEYEFNNRNRLFDVAPDGQHFYLLRQAGGDQSGDLIIVQNLFEELKAKAGNE